MPQFVGLVSSFVLAVGAALAWAAVWGVVCLVGLVAFSFCADAVS